MKLYSLVFMAGLWLCSSPAFALQGLPDTPGSSGNVKTGESIDVDEVLCPKSNAIGKLLKNTCWEGYFPMYIAGVRLGGKERYSPSNRNEDRLCACGGDLAEGIAPTAGTSLGMFNIKYLMEVTSKPYCFPTLGKELSSRLGLTSRFNVGNEDNENTENEGFSNTSSFSWHLAMFPLTRMLELFDDFTCGQDLAVTFDYLWMSETLPMYYDEELANILTPENIAIAAGNFAGQSLAMAVLPIDCIASSTPGFHPVDELFWVAGCWGNLYPLAAPINTTADKVQGKSLIATRALYFLSRIGMLNRTMGEDVLCEEAKMPFLKRSQYRMSQYWPMAEAGTNETLCTGEEGCSGASYSNTGADEPDQARTQVSSSSTSANGLDKLAINSLNSTCTHKVGETSYRWGVHRDAKQEDHALYLIYQWRDCCLDALKYL